MSENRKEEGNAAKTILEFYLDLVENDSSKAKFYLAENVILDWFGKTVKGNKKVLVHIKEQICKVTHHISNAVPSENVAFKDTHHIKVPKTDENVIAIPSPPSKILTTPPKRAQPSTSMIEMGQGDGLHNCPLLSPPKRMKFSSEEEEGGDVETVENESEAAQLKYLTAEGSVEFHRPSIKKLQTETRWRRPAKLHLGYTTSSFKDCTIYLIIYEGNLKCRRNLYKEFCESEPNT